MARRGWVTEPEDEDDAEEEGAKIIDGQLHMLYSSLQGYKRTAFGRSLLLPDGAPEPLGSAFTY